MTDKQSRFARAYCVSGNVTQAARAAGYGRYAHQSGRRALLSPVVAEYVQRTMRANGLGPDDVVREVTSLALGADDERVRLHALQTIGKLWALFPDRAEHKIDRAPPEPRTRAEVLADLQERLALSGGRTQADVVGLIAAPAVTPPAPGPPAPPPHLNRAPLEDDIYIPPSEPASKNTIVKDTDNTGTATESVVSANPLFSPEPSCLVCGQPLDDSLWRWSRDKSGKDKYCTPACQGAAETQRLGSECKRMLSLLGGLDSDRRLTKDEREVTLQSRKSGLNAYYGRLKFLCESRGIDLGKDAEVALALQPVTIGVPEGASKPEEMT